MNLSMITMQQVLVLFLLIFAGFIGVKSGAVSKDSRKGFSDLLVYLVVPAMIVNSYITEFHTDILQNLILAFGLSWVALLIGMAAAYVFTWKQKDKNTPILKFAISFSNAAYMGFPLIQALFGAEGLLYASVFVTVFNILLWTVGYSIVTGKTQMKEVLRSIASTPVIYAVLLGLLIFLLQIPVPSLIKQPLSLIGNMNTPLSMIITGMIIAGSNIKAMLTNKKIWYALAVRMLVIPALCLGIFYVLGVSGTVVKIVLLLEACPSAAITSVFAVRYHYDEDFAAGIVVLTTFVSILTLPLVALLLNYL